MLQRPSIYTVFPYTTLFRSPLATVRRGPASRRARGNRRRHVEVAIIGDVICPLHLHPTRDRKSTRLNSSHVEISYAVFCLKKKSILCYIKMIYQLIKHMPRP